MADHPIQQNPPGAYVYAIVVDGVVRYIGKGRGRRVFRHLSTVRTLARRKALGESVRAVGFYRRMLAAWEEGAAIQHVILAKGLSDIDAFDLEIATIASSSGESLWNFQDGGQGTTSAAAKKKWSDPEYRKRQMAAWYDPAVCAKKSAVQKIVQSDPDLCARRSAAQKRAWQRPETIQKKINAAKSAWQKPGYRERIIKARIAKWSDPAFKLKSSVFRKAQWANPDYRAMMLAARCRGVRSD